MPQDDHETTERPRDPGTDGEHAQAAAATTPPGEAGNDRDENDETPILPLLDRYELLRECEALVIYLACHGDALQEADELKDSYDRLSRAVFILM